MGRARRDAGAPWDASGTLDPAMVDVWARLEPLLAKVQKPARYIGCEDGAAGPGAPPRHRSAWLLAYPDTYEIGLPNQGLQILYEILNERPDAVAERTYAPWIDLEALLRERRAAAVLGRHPPAAPTSSTCWPSTCRPSSSTRTSSTASTWPACPCGPPTAAATHPLVGAGGHCTYNPEPLADFLDFVVLGDGEEVGRRDHRGASATWKAAGRHGRGTTCCGRSRRRRGRVRARRCTTSPTTDGRLVGDHAPLRRRARRRSRSARSPTWPTGRTRSASSCRSPRSSTTGSTSRCSGAAPAAAASARPGMITRPVRERPAEQVADDGAARACAAPATTRWRSPSLSTADFSGIEDGRARRRSTTRHRLRQRLGVAAEPAGRRVHRRHRRRRSRRPAAPGSRSPPRPARGACAR